MIVRRIHVNTVYFLSEANVSRLHFLLALVNRIDVLDTIGIFEFHSIRFTAEVRMECNCERERGTLFVLHGEVERELVSIGSQCGKFPTGHNRRLVACVTGFCVRYV